jgi:dipeptidyl aminopeptidase/acylaminoacyl peptidase
VTTLSTGARSPRFSPDGDAILFTSLVDPAANNDEDSKRIAEEKKARKHNVRVYTGFPIRNWDRWMDERQIRPFVQPLDGGSARDLLAGSQLVAGPGYGGRQTDTGEELDAEWTPDGAGIVFAATTNRHTAAYAFTHADLWQVAVAGGEPVRLTGDGSTAAQDSYSRPQFAPDGRTLYAQVTPRTAKVYNTTRVAAWTWPAKERRADIAAPGTLAIGAYAPAARGGIWFSAESDGIERVYRGEPGRDAVLVSTGTRGVYTQLVANERGRDTVVALYDSATEPAELVRIDTRRGTHARITSNNVDAAAALDLAPVEHFTVPNARGVPVHSMLVRPAGFDPARKYPLFVLIHGGPNIMWRDTFFLRWNYHLLAGSDYVLLLTNYTGSTGFGEAFAQGIEGDPLKGPGEEINQAAAAAIERFAFIDGERQCAGGASYGGHLANWLQATTTHYQCLISHAGLVNLESQWGTSDAVYHREVGAGGPVWEQGPVWREQNPIRYAAKFRTPTLVTIGELDYRVPLNNSLEYWTVLQRMQVESKLLVFPDENHWILKGENSRYFYGEVKAWLDKYLKK